MRLAVFIDGTFIPERDGASTRFAQMPRHLSQQGTEVTVFHCYRGWSNLDRIAMEPFPTYFFPAEVFYSDIDCLVRILQDIGVDVIQMNDAETIMRIGFRLAQALDVKVVYEAHYHTSTLATALGASSDRVEALRCLERDVSAYVDHLIVFTDEDRYRWVTLSGCCEDRVSVVPFGVDHVVSGQYPGERQGLVFIGNLFYEPNRRAVERIATEIMPILRRVRRGERVVVIGDIPADLRKLCFDAGIEAIGEVSDPLPWLTRAAVGLAPVSEASGVRAKILQCLAAGMPVVATPPSVEGLSLPALLSKKTLRMSPCGARTCWGGRSIMSHSSAVRSALFAKLASGRISREPQLGSMNEFRGRCRCAEHLGRKTSLLVYPCGLKKSFKRADSLMPTLPS